MKGRIILSFPKNQFTEDFINTEVNKELGIRGDMLPQYIKSKNIHSNYKPSVLFNHNTVYCCKAVHDQVILVAAI